MSEDLDQFYRKSDNQFRIAGGEEGITKLANDFYDIMESQPEAQKILKMHPKDLTMSRDKLALFLIGYLDGPPLYHEKYGKIQLSPAHAHLAIGTPEKETWLSCMKQAIGKQDWPEEFKAFVFKRLQTPAERCRNRP